MTAVWIFAVFGMIALTSLASTVTAEGLAVRQAPDVFMSKDQRGEERVDSFDCHDAIYIHAVFLNLGSRGHEASVEWINPKRLRQSNYSHRFNAGNYHAWFNLKLHPAFGGRFLKALDPSAGMGEHMGMWGARFYLDGKLIADKVFYVAC